MFYVGFNSFTLEILVSHVGFNSFAPEILVFLVGSNVFLGVQSFRESCFMWVLAALLPIPSRKQYISSSKLKAQGQGWASPQNRPKMSQLYKLLI